MSDNLLSDRVYNWFVSQLHEGKLQPGQHLNRRQVAEQVGVSVAPVLEAMVRLEAEGFLNTVPRRGTRIRPIQSSDVDGQRLLREAIECQAARVYCGPGVIDAEPTLMKLARKVDASFVNGDIDHEAHFAFHGALVELAACDALTATYEKVVRRALYYAANDMMPTPTAAVSDPHVQLVEALKSDDPDAAERAVRSHIRGAAGAEHTQLRGATA